MEWSIQQADSTCGASATQKKLADMIGTIELLAVPSESRGHETGIAPTD